jgi:uncharacterized protein (DUF362 family)
MKNWYGILGGQRAQLHQHIHDVDSYRVFLRNGPTGGNLEDVLLEKTLIAGTDPIALDVYVAKVNWNMDVSAIPYLKMASARNLGTPDFENLRVQVVNLS